MILSAIVSPEEEDYNFGQLEPEAFTLLPYHRA